MRLSEKNAKDLSFDQIKSLLYICSNLELNHIKWFRNINSIEMKETPYLLSNTENKRSVIYENDKAKDTKPFTLKNNFKI